MRSSIHPALARAAGVAVVLSAIGWIAPDAARAETEWVIKKPESHPAHHLDVLVSTTGGSVFGVAPGVLYGIPIVPDGFISALNDSFEIEFGAFMFIWFGSSQTYLWVTPQGGVRWNFWLTKAFSVYGTAKIGAAIALTSGFSHGIYGFGGVGLDWEFTEGMSLRAETGGGRGGAGLTGGLSFKF